MFAGTLKNNEYDCAADAVCDNVVGIAVLHDDDVGFGDDTGSAMLPVKYDRYGTSIGHFSEMFFQCWTCHLGLEVE